MRVPPSIRYLPARLQPLGNPAILLPAFAMLLTGIFVWEYRTHPEWLKLPEGDVTTLPTTTGLSTDERAQVADIDNLGVLVEQTQANLPQLPPVAGQTTPGQDPNTQLGQNQANQPTNGINPDQANSSGNPFQTYLDQYRFLGAPSVSAAPNQASVNRNMSQLRLANGSQGGSSGNNRLFLLPSGNNNPSREGTSALARAMAAQQQTQAPANAGLEANSRNALGTNGTNSSLNATGTSAQPTGLAQSQANAGLPSNNTNPANLNLSQTAPFSQQGVVRGSLPGSPTTFLRTTPQMSPPPGTTGYVPPASLNLPTFSNTYNRPTGIAPTTPSYGLRQPQATPNALPGTFQSGAAGSTVVPGALNQGVPPAQPIQPSAFDEFFQRY
jgi:hypothetical protein